MASKLGTSRELSVVKELRAAGFISSKTSHSGQRVGESAKKDGLAADVIGLARTGSMESNVLVEVGGASKNLRQAFAEMRSLNLRDFDLYVVKFMKPKGLDKTRKSWYNLDAYGKPVRLKESPWKRKSASRNT